MNDYRVKIVTDGEKVENTFIYMDGVRISYLQEFAIEAGVESILVPVNMTVLPLPIEDVVFEDSDTEAAEKIAQFKNTIEIYTNGRSTGTNIYVNGTIIGFLQRFSLYANAGLENIELEFEQFDRELKETKTVILKDFISYKE